MNIEFEITMGFGKARPIKMVVSVISLLWTLTLVFVVFLTLKDILTIDNWWIVLVVLGVLGVLTLPIVWWGLKTERMAIEADIDCVSGRIHD